MTLKPNFLVTGAAKSGTTWLHLCLSEHPDVFLPNAKELHYFSYDSRYEKGVAWYEDFFPKNSDQSAIGEVSPSYLCSSEAPERIYQYNPQMKLVCILRNPIERAYSHYCMDLVTGTANPDMAIGLGAQSPYVSWGLYHEQLARYLEFFPREQLKVVLFDDLKANPKAFLTDIYEFLGIDASFSASIMNQPKNTKKSLPKFPKTYRSLKSIYRNLMEVPIARDLLVPLRLKGYFNFFHRLNRGERFPDLTPERKHFLADFYRQDLAKVSTLLDRDLSSWLAAYENA